MKRKNLIAKRKVKKSNLLIKDFKILNYYSKIKPIIFKNINNKSFALAVSGGPDSLSLAYFAKIYASEFKNKLHVLIVDHRLRKESQFEAIKVKSLLKKKGINSKILAWKGLVPKKNIQKNARNIRYSLIYDYCLKEKVKYLLMGHHLDDQIENFFIRLLRGSGLTGLSPMSEVSKYTDKLKIVRPLLSLKKNDLKYVARKYFKFYIKDPSNKDEKFLRVRIRRYRKEMEKEGLDFRKILKTLNNLLSANKAIDFYKNKALYKHASFLSKNRCIVDTKIFTEEANEIVFKSFSDILSLISGTYYPPRSKKIINLIKRIKKNKFDKSTLGGCIIEKKHDTVLISKEFKIKKVLLSGSKTSVF